MKFLPIFLLPLVTLVFAAEFQEVGEAGQRSISSQVINAIENIKEQMPCGFPIYDIPPLAPFETSYQVIEIETDDIQVYGEISNFRLDGLNDFDIVDFRVNAIFSRVNFKFNWNRVYFNTNYNMSTSRSGKGLRRTGPAKFALKNFTIWGVLKYNLSLISGKLSVKELSVYVSLGEVKSEIGGLSKISIINKKLNRIIEEWFMITVNDNTNRMAEWTNSMVVPYLNDILNDMTISDIVNVIGGVSGENEGEPREPCIPPGIN